MSTKWRGLNAATLTITVGLIALAWMIIAGYFDPGIPGTATELDYPGTLTAPAGEQQLVWLSELDPLPRDFAVQLTGRQLTGDAESAYGLAVGRSDSALAISVSPAGYVSIWQETATGVQVLLPWQTWPHIQENENELWLERTGDHWQVRLNREYLWEGDVIVEGSAIALLVQSQTHVSTVEFPKLTLFR